MKTVLIMRHAKSSWDDAGVSDHDRTLNARGRRDAPFMGEFLGNRGLRPDLIAHSTATRAALTAQIVAEQFEPALHLHSSSDFYLAPARVYLESIAALNNDYDCVMFVGHNPGMEELVSQFIADDYSMPTAAIAHIQLATDTWSDVETSNLDSLTIEDSLAVWRPKEVR